MPAEKREVWQVFGEMAGEVLAEERARHRGRRRRTRAQLRGLVWASARSIRPERRRQLITS
eukprot:5121762-Alexandrium_andersonii.AAC.1